MSPHTTTEPTRPYRPANGIEGEGFFENWCYRCRFDAFDHETGKGSPCPILAATLRHDESSPLYPSQYWRQDGSGAAECLMFEERES